MTKRQITFFVSLALAFVAFPSFAAVMIFVEDDQYEEKMLALLQEADEAGFISLAQRISARGKSLPKIQAVLADRLTSKNVQLRASCVDAIPYLGPAKKQTIKKMIVSMALGGLVKSSSEPYTKVVADALEKIGPTTLPVAIEYLNTKNFDQYIGVTDLISRLGDHAEDAIEPLVKNLKPGKFQWSTTYALMGIGEEATTAIEGLRKMLESDKFNTVCIACRALAKMGSAGLAAKEKLKEIAQKGNVSERGRALEALGGIGAANDDPDVQKLMEEGFEAFHQSIRERVTVGVELMGKKGKSFIPIVEKAIRDPTYKSKHFAGIALYKIGGSKDLALETLMKATKNPVFEIDAIRWIGEFKNDGQAAIPLLTQYLDGTDEDLKTTVIETLFKIGIDAKIKKKLESILVTDGYLSVRAARKTLADLEKNPTPKCQ